MSRWLITHYATEAYVGTAVSHVTDNIRPASGSSFQFRGVNIQRKCDVTAPCNGFGAKPCKATHKNLQLSRQICKYRKTAIIFFGRLFEQYWINLSALPTAHLFCLGQVACRRFHKHGGSSGCEILFYWVPPRK